MRLICKDCKSEIVAPPGITKGVEARTTLILRCRRCGKDNAFQVSNEAVVAAVKPPVAAP